ncbi:hypothetical protein DSO57_1006917 [Entomophthora muscae]|uniref:Uncharacterized protein n=1 Tax=Entomophthora muscae TaxID=34485 RepID=A0ACC2U6J9_9FUNG|nr:hypothetical protein DSO57_1006917 [Entomophthora muscae]
MKRSGCKDKKRISDLLLENNNKLKKVLHILKDENKEFLAEPSYLEASSPNYSCPEGDVPAYCDDLPTNIKCKSKQESTKELAALIEPLSTSDILPSKLQPASPIEASSSSVSLKSPCRDEEEEEKVSSKKAKSNIHGTPTDEKAHFTEPAVLIEPLPASDFIPSKLQTASPLEVISSSLFLKSSHQDEEEEKVFPEKAKSNNNDTLSKTETSSTSLSAIP